MNYRPYPDPDRAMRQLARHRIHRTGTSTLSGLLDGMGMKLEPFQRAWVDTCLHTGTTPAVSARRSGRTAIIAAIADEATAVGEHVHVASRDGMRCAGGDPNCPLPRTERDDQDEAEHDGRSTRDDATDPPARSHRDGPPADLSATLRPAGELLVKGLNRAAANATVFSRALAQAGISAESERARALAAGRCPDCGHAPHAAGSECEAVVDHGPKHWHRCLCLYQPPSTSPCHPLMTCHGGTLGYSDIWHLQRGHSLSSKDGPVTPDILAIPTGTTDQEPITLARVVRTCAACPSQWNAWTTSGQYLYLRYRSGIGTVDAYDTEDSSTWMRIPDGSVARFDTGDRLDGEMSLVEFCERTDLELADAEVIGE